VLAWAAVAAVTWALPAGRAAGPDAAEGATVQQFSQATSQLYGRISASLIRIRVDQSPSAFLPPNMLREFQEWRRNQPNADDGDNRGEGRGDGRPDRGMGGGRRGSGPGWNGGNGQDGRGGRRGFGGGGAGGGAEDLPTRGILQANPGLVRRFIEQKANAVGDRDPNQAAALRGLLFRIEAVRAGVTGDLYGVVIDEKGTAIVLTALLREAQGEALRVTAPDGTETTAKFVGSHPRGYTIIQLDKPGAATPLAFAEGRPAAGALLLAVAASNGATGWMVTPAKFGKRPADERMALFGNDDRGGTFVFDTNGHLAALGWGRFALPIDTLNRDIQWIVENRKDVTPRQLGVRYSLVPGTNQPRNPRDAARVESVQPGSLAEKAGLKKNDIVVSVDKRPLTQLPQIQLDLATRSGTAPMGIVRDGKEMTLEMKLDSK
jgi:S1-C subfamily serine protease